MDIFKPTKSFLKSSACHGESVVFTMLCKTTAGVLVALCLLSGVWTILTNQIECYSSVKLEGAADIAKYFCLITSTYSNEETLDKVLPNKLPERKIAFPGAGNIRSENQKVFHTYYLWVHCFLILQAVTFYLPYYIWKRFEGGRCKSMVMSMNLPHISVKDKIECKKNFFELLKLHFHNQKRYAIWYFICEALSFINIFVQIYLTDIFLGRKFLLYGFHFIKSQTVEDHLIEDVMTYVFPRVASCNYWKIGDSGSVVNVDLMCSLTLNAINDKIFLVLYFWFLLMAIMTIFAAIFRALVLVFPFVRLSMLMSGMKSISGFERVFRVFHIGDWFLLYQIKKNINPRIFTEIMHELAAKTNSADEVVANDCPSTKNGDKTLLCTD